MKKRKDLFTALELRLKCKKLVKQIITNANDDPQFGYATLNEFVKVLEQFKEENEQ